MSLKEYTYSASLEDGSTTSKVLSHVGHGTTVLELGCSVGTQTRLMVETLRCRVSGVELNPEAARKAEIYCDRVVVGSLETMDLAHEFENETFDIILCADVLEHLRNPQQVLKQLAPLLNPNGRLIISVPNIAHAALTHELANGRFEYRSWGLLDDTHITFFTRDSLIALLTRCGFKITSLDRSVKEHWATEFRLSDAELEDRIFLDYMLTKNIEANTYQFIVVAQPSLEATAIIDSLNRNFEHRNITDYELLCNSGREASRDRLHHYFKICPKSHSLLTWKSGRFWPRLRTRTADSLRRILGRRG